jgi:hypothetical protein
MSEVPRRSRTQRLWLAAVGSIWAPVLITVSGLTGFWPILAVCAAAVIWTLWLFRRDIGQLTTEVAPSERHQHPIWLMLPGLAVLCFAVYPFVRLYESLAHQPVGLTANEFAQPYLRGYSFRIVDLAGTDGIIRNKVFEDCWIYGPAILYGSGDDVYLVQSLFNENTPGHKLTADDIFIETPDNRVITSAVVLQHCTIRRCHLINIQVIGTRDLIDKWKRNLEPLSQAPPDLR